VSAALQQLFDTADLSQVIRSGNRPAAPERLATRGIDPGSQKEDLMAQRNLDDPYRPGPTDDDLPMRSRLDEDLPPDPEITQGPVTAGRIAAFAVAIVLAFAAVFYGMNSAALNPKSPAVATQSGPAQTNAQNSAQPPTGSVRDVTPLANTEPGTTTGAAPQRAPTTPQEGAPGAATK
jgi:hypothetical protein